MVKREAARLGNARLRPRRGVQPGVGHYAGRAGTRGKAKSVSWACAELREGKSGGVDRLSGVPSGVLTRATRPRGARP